MLGGLRVLGLGRVILSREAAGWLLCAGLWAMASCTLPSQGDLSQPSLGPSAGFGGSLAISVGGAAFGFGGSEPSCAPPSASTPVFAAQELAQQLLFAREFYTWATAEQASALRQNKDLFSQAAGSGAPFDTLANLVSASGAQAGLAQALSSSFQKGRYAWPEPWATRMGWPGRDPGGQLVRIVLKPEAWLAVVEAGQVFVFNAQQQQVATTDALSNQAQIGAIYFDSSRPSPDATCASATGGYREFLVANLAMVQEWSLGTQQIHDRVLANIGQLTQFLNATRSCPVTIDAVSWAQSVLCSWRAQMSDQQGPSGFGGAGAGVGAGGSGAAGALSFPASPRGNVTEEFAYEQALAIPSASYLAAPAQLATMIETLRGDLFEPDPLVVTPGSP